MTHTETTTTAKGATRTETPDGSWLESAQVPGGEHPVTIMIGFAGPRAEGWQRYLVTRMGGLAGATSKWFATEDQARQQARKFWSQAKAANERRDAKDRAESREAVTEAQRSQSINPPRSAYSGPRAKVTEPGIYRRGANVYKVVKSQQGRLYAKLLKERTDNDHLTHRMGWYYEAGAMAYLTPDMKLSLEQAQEYGRQTGICVQCGRELTHEVSIQRGMGPICYGKWYDED